MRQQAAAAPTEQFPEFYHAVAAGCCCQLRAGGCAVVHRQVPGYIQPPAACRHPWMPGRLPPTHQHGWRGDVAPARSAGGDWHAASLGGHAGVTAAAAGQSGKRDWQRGWAALPAPCAAARLAPAGQILQGCAWIPRRSTEPKIPGIDFAALHNSQILPPPPWARLCALTPLHLGRSDSWKAGTRRIAATPPSPSPCIFPQLQRHTGWCGTRQAGGPCVALRRSSGSLQAAGLNSA